MRSMRKSRAPICWCGGLVLAALVAAAPAFAGESQDDVDNPTFVICTRSVDALIQRAEHVLTLAGAEDRIDRMREIITFLNDLDGVDRKQPVGLFVYVPPPGAEPEVVGFIPVARLDNLRQTVTRIDGLNVSPGDADDEWILQSGEKTLHVRIADDYAYVAQNRSRLAGTLPDVVEHTRDLTDQYDAAVSFRRSGLPPIYSAAVMAKLHQDAASDLLRKEHESDSEYRLRKRASESLMWLVEQVVTSSERATIGLSLAGEDQTIKLDAILQATEQSELARLLGSLAGEESGPAIADDDAVGLQVDTSLTLTGEGRDVLSEVVRQLRAEVDRDLGKDPSARAVLEQPLSVILDSLEGTVEAGRFQGALRIMGDAPGQMVMLAGIRIEQADDVGEALREFLPFLAHSEDVRRIDLDAGSAADVDFHRIVHKQVRKQDRFLYGPEPGLYLGAGRGALWLALGGSETPHVLRRAVTDAVEHQTRPATAGPLPLLMVDIRMTPWIEFIRSGTGNREKAFAAAAQAAFADTHRDRLHAELTAREGELRLSVRMDEAYLRMLGPLLVDRKRSPSPDEPQTELLRPRSSKPDR